MSAGVLGIGAGYGIAPPRWERFARQVQQGQYAFVFFTAEEQPTIRMLADMIIPRDERSGPATEAGTVEYMDFVLSESGENTRTLWHDGFRWLDAETWQRFNKRRFIEATEAERTAMLDDIAFPATARPELRQAVAWFTRVRELTGSGFFSSRVGVEDIGYIGGIFNPTWQGAPPEALAELNVSYADWDRRYGGRR